MSREGRRAWVILALCFLYAAARYVLFGGYPPAMMPAWVLNKALALFRLRRTGRAWLLLGLGALLTHLATLSGDTWYHPGAWPRALPPITLLGFLGAALALGWMLPAWPAEDACRPTPGP